MSLFTGGIALATALAGAGTAGAFGLAGASKSAGAAEHAADLQAKATQEALDFTKAQKAKQEAAAAPYLSLGQMATQNLPGAVRPMPTQGPPSPYTTQPQATRPMPMSAMGQPSAPPLGGIQQQPMVMLEAPNGARKSVPANQADAYIQRGAKRVG